MIWILLFVTVQRLFELLLAERNTRALKAKGAIEHSPEHYIFIVALHMCWLLGLWWVAITQSPPIHLFWISIFFVLQCGRIWVLMTLGERWTTRIIVLPNAPLIQSGPYRWVSHPNYIIVIGEIAALPLAFELPIFAAVFSLLNGIILYYRIREENIALRRS